MKLLIVDDHAVVRSGIRRLLADLRGAEIGEAETTEQARASARLTAPDVVLLDLRLGDEDGFDLLPQLLEIAPKARIIVFSILADAMHVTRALSQGARGYVTKAAGGDELAAAVKRVLEGGRYIDREIATRLAFGAEEGHPMEKLSPRESEIMQLLGSGLSLSDIASTMGVAYKTVANTCGVIKSKLGVSRNSELIRIAIGLRQK